MHKPNMLKMTPHDYRIKIEDEELNLIKKSGIKKILEVCSGDGRNLAYFSKQGYEVYGIESNNNLIKKSLKLMKTEGASAKISKHPIFTKKFPFKNEEFDLVYSYQYINHNSKDKIEKVFKEIFRVLKKGGIFSIKTSDMEQLSLKHINNDIYEECGPEFPKIKYKKTAEQTFKKLEGDEKGILHYAFHKNELANSLQKTGFKPINIRKIKWNIIGNFTK